MVVEVALYEAERKRPIVTEFVEIELRASRLFLIPVFVYKPYL